MQMRGSCNRQASKLCRAILWQAEKHEYVVSGSRDKTVRVWDAHTGAAHAHVGSLTIP